MFGGGAGGGKSWLGCEWLLTNCYFYPGSKWFIGREELKRLMASTYVTFMKVCKHHGIPQDDWWLNGQYNYIEFKNGSRIDLLDMAYKPSDPLYERFGSLEYTGGWIEEAGEVDYLAFDVLKSRVGRHMNKEYNLASKIFITCNPKKNWLYTVVYRPWREGKLPQEYAFIQSLFGDNQFTAQEYQENLSQIKDRATKERLMFGNWEYDDDPAVLINYEAIIDLFTNSVLAVADKYMSADVARYGADKTVVMIWEGLKVTKIIVREKQGIDQTIALLRQIAFEEQIPYSHIIVDEDGVGGGVVDGMRGVKGFVANSQPFPNMRTGKPDNFQNLKTQCYYFLADQVNNHLIAVDCQDIKIRQALTEELEQVKSKDLDKDGKIKLVQKDEIREVLGRSPDYADSLMMRMYFEIAPKTRQGEAVKQYYPSHLKR